MPSRSRWCFTLLLGVAAAVMPIGAAALARFMPEAATRLEYLSVGTLSALMIGQLVGLRRGRLQSFLVGPAVGFVAGWLDLQVFGWLYSLAGWSLGSAALVPAWGAVFGLWIACYAKTWPGRILRVVALAGADLAARWGWGLLVAYGLLVSLGEWRWVVESLVYSPTAILAIALTKRAEDSDVADAAPAPRA